MPQYPLEEIYLIGGQIELVPRGVGPSTIADPPSRVLRNFYYGSVVGPITQEQYDERKAWTGAEPCADGDEDRDFVCDPDDNCPMDSNPDQADGDGDGIGNACESSECSVAPMRSTGTPMWLLLAMLVLAVRTRRQSSPSS